MALMGLDISETREVISKYDPDTNNPTVFEIGVLEPIVRAQIDDESSSFEISSNNPNDPAKASINTNKRDIMAVRFGLKGIKNFIHPQTKKEIPFRTEAVHYAGKMRDVVSFSIIDMIPAKVRKELAGVILSENRMSEQEEKN